MGARIRALRDALALSQEDFGDRVKPGTTQSRVSEWERERPRPGLGTLRLISDIIRPFAAKHTDAVYQWLVDGGEFPVDVLWLRHRRMEHDIYGEAQLEAEASRRGTPSSMGLSDPLAKDFRGLYSWQVGQLLPLLEQGGTMPVEQVLELLNALFTRGIEEIERLKRAGGGQAGGGAGA